MKKFLTLGTFAALAFSASAVEIEVGADPALPANLLKNASFEEGMANWRMSPADNGSEIVEGNAADGAKCVKIPGAKDKNPNLYQGARVNTIKAGDPIYFRVYAKKTGADIDAKPASLACQVSLAGAKPRYLPVPQLPREDFDWARFESVASAPGDLTSFSFYLCHYKQEGDFFADNLVVAGGKTRLTVSVKGDDLKKVVVRHSTTGIVLNENVSGREFTKTFAVPAFGSYSVEVTDAKGARTAKLYPADVDANVAASDKVLPLLPGFRVILPPGQSESFPVTLPEAAAGKKVYLEYQARIQQVKGVSGHTAAHKVMVNGKQLGAKELVHPANRFEMSSGSAVTVATNRGFVTYYSNACFAISPENPYCPATLKDRNPFAFKLDITNLVKPGANTVTFQSTYSSPKLKLDVYVEQPRLVIE